ncbi:MAG: hypothetical protein EOO77_45255 [Oxalobacteraceae bacterium]|nr:MAG: hypothetical protein EOO77_45255 [Oxalobacteraceae bacterium]
MGRIIAVFPMQTGESWLVCWDVLGFQDYLESVKPWCTTNLEDHDFEVSSSIRVYSEEDATLLRLRFE